MFWLSANSNNTDLASRIGDRRCEWRALDRYIHQQLDDSPTTQRNQQDEHQEKRMAGKNRISEGGYGNTRNYVPIRGLKKDGDYLSHVRRLHNNMR